MVQGSTSAVVGGGLISKYTAAVCVLCMSSLFLNDFSIFTLTSFLCSSGISIPPLVFHGSSTSSKKYPFQTAETSTVCFNQDLS
jgi:hypothetical protein